MRCKERKKEREIELQKETRFDSGEMTSKWKNRDAKPEITTIASYLFYKE